MTLVREFHEAFVQPAPSHPPLRVDPDVVRFRARLIREEYEEVKVELEALSAGCSDPLVVHETLSKLLKELADLRYVLEGAAVTFGLPIDEAFAEVHRSNLSKLLPDGSVLRREDGKVLKGPNYTEADMSKLVPPIIEGELIT